MFQTVELPVWALILMALLAAVTAASHLLFPSVRWFFRRRAERVVGRLNERLARPIQPFKLAQRHDMIQNVLYDPEVIRAVNEYAEENGVPDNVAFETATRYAKEIVPSFSASVYFGIGTRLAKWLARSLYRVRVVKTGADGLDAIDPDATVVFIINHRSNMDYVLVTYLVAEDAALSYAVGEWARGWPLQPLIKMMGGYFIRRRFLNPLYRKVLARYVQLSTREGVAQAVFPEGGLSRDGSLRDPKLGLISYIVDGFDPAGLRDVVFVPVGLNYDRVLEDRVLVKAAGNSRARFKFRMSTVARYVARHAWARVTGRFHRQGFAAVAFGKPISLKTFLMTASEDVPTALGKTLIENVGSVVPVLPVPLIAWHLVAAEGQLAREELQIRFDQDVARLNAQHHPLCLPQSGSEKAVREALNMLKTRGLVGIKGDTVVSKDPQMKLLTYYAASVDHALTDKT
ncbi:1-acyl-sn-glycerol-3-phosphate acyltransferase [Litoreibacter roseus]|uniref:Glycerol-3-phosphate acyltransferase n=1 Tax=Litoreibacter roseus TaxID=2601869 RepID=A0A6N6JDL9_9RHOB|nr:1-acyl-sn-glycerol-3-phosphate acyltransferase [Litoreibacter roseus]GFE63292.1 glycerol-3-phosphate 1-O-acyltransferase [Litoreibacter roseus]